MRKFDRTGGLLDTPLPEAVNDWYKPAQVRGDMGLFEPSMARQEFADECDINVLMARYEAGGAVTHVNQAVPVYMDVTAVPDLRGAMDAMRVATAAFLSLPAKVRRQFDNDPQAFVDFAQDGVNLEQMRSWGLAPAVEPVPPPLRVEVVSPPPGPDPGGSK